MNKVNEIMITWENNYFILEELVYSGRLYRVKTCIDKVWEERRFYSKKRVISFYRSVRQKVVGANHGSLLEYQYKVDYERLVKVLA